MRGISLFSSSYGAGDRRLVVVARPRARTLGSSLDAQHARRGRHLLLPYLIDASHRSPRCRGGKQSDVSRRWRAYNRDQEVISIGESGFNHCCKRPGRWRRFAPHRRRRSFGARAGADVMETLTTLIIASFSLRHRRRRRLPPHCSKGCMMMAPTGITSRLRQSRRLREVCSYALRANLKFTSAGQMAAASSGRQGDIVILPLNRIICRSDAHEPHDVDIHDTLHFPRCQE